MTPKGRFGRQPNRAEVSEALPLAVPKDVAERLPLTWQATFSLRSDRVRKELKEIELQDAPGGADQPPLNSGLILDKYMPNLDRLGGINGKGHLLLGVERYFESRGSRYQDLLTKLGARQAALLEALKVRYPGTQTAAEPATVVWRMVVGIGRPHVWENAMALHPLYGFPYIPGSSVKGLVRLAAFWQIAERLRLKRGESVEGAHETWLFRLDRLLSTKTESSAWQTAGFPNFDDSIFETMIQDAQALLGTVGRKGRGIFLDALPQAFPTIEADIMNPHFQKYYQQGPEGKQPPSDDLEPNPIFFLTVGKSTTFSFPMAVLPGKPGELDAGTLLGIARNWFNQAITEFGVGAKTRAGYGALRPPDSLPAEPA